MAKKKELIIEQDPKDPTRAIVNDPTGKRFWTIQTHPDGKLSVHFVCTSTWNPDQNCVFSGVFRIAPNAANSITLHPVSELVT